MCMYLHTKFQVSNIKNQTNTIKEHEGKLINAIVNQKTQLYLINNDEGNLILKLKIVY